MMKITKFKNFISEFPYLNQAFDIKKENWKVQFQQTEIDALFNNQKAITLNRFDLINSRHNLESFTIKTLMWGYPTKGRGKNIDKLLEPTNFNNLIKILEHYQDRNITIEQLKSDIKRIPGLGLSTITKFTHFLGTTIEGKKAVILDNQIIEAINTNRFEEFKSIQGISYDNAQSKYVNYITIIDKLANKMKVYPDQIEIFLFMFGRNLSEIRGEECYDYV